MTTMIGNRQQHPHKSFSPQSVAAAVAFKPRPTDVFVLTPPKTGTTWMQMVTHCLRMATKDQNGGDSADAAVGDSSKAGVDPGRSSKRPKLESADAPPDDGPASSVSTPKQDWKVAALDFEDIYQVAPWAQMSWDLGIELDAEQRANPRLFKTHQRLSAINPGARYLVVVREPSNTARSWYNFLKDKDVPPLRKYWDAASGPGLSGFVQDPDFFAPPGGMRFGGTLWEYYAEFAACLSDPTVLVLAYEDLVKDLRGHLPLIADFMGLAGLTEAQADEVAVMGSKSFMSSPEHSSKFDESWTFKRLGELKRMSSDQRKSFAPAPRVHLKAQLDTLDPKAQACLEEWWKAGMPADLPDYAALVRKIRAEHARRGHSPTVAT